MLITKPMGIYLLRVLDPEQEGGMGILEKILGPVERLVYKIARVDPKKQQNWKQYCSSLLIWAGDDCCSATDCTACRTSCRSSEHGEPAAVDKTTLSPLDANGNHQRRRQGPGDHRVHPGVSFATNTDWQSYEPEQMFTYFSQMVHDAASLLLFVDVGIAVAAVLVRGVARKQTTDIGNFWVDLTRMHALSVPADLPGLRHAGCLAGNSDEFPAVHAGEGGGSIQRASPTSPVTADDAAGADGVVLRTESAGPQRSRIHRRRLRHPV